MGTRADFYVGRGETAEWLGSIAWDGHPDSDPAGLTGFASEKEWRDGVAAFLASRQDATLPAQGWPWPWDDSRTTDYAYAFDEGKVWAAQYGYVWFAAAGPHPSEEETPPFKTCVFPDMTARKNVTLGERSGLIVFGLGGEEQP